MNRKLVDSILKRSQDYLQGLKGKKVAMLLSGGVDSSVALALLKYVGVDVTAFYLKIWLEDEIRFLGGDCPWEEDVKFVEKVCKNLDVNYEIIPLQKEYFQQVVAYTIEEVKKGRTPNPDVMCNSKIKFGSFVDKVKRLDFDFVASGHYAFKNRLGYELRLSEDKFKDQTYFLSFLKSEQLNNLIFPIGFLKKDEVRLLAEYFELANQDRKDSQGICFLGKLKFNDFIKHYLGEMKGKIVDFDTNTEVGTHDGFYFYTLGQRKGIGLSGGPWFVVKKDIEKNIVYVSKSYFEDDKPRNQFWVEDINIFNKGDEIQARYSVKIRHGEKMYNIAKLEKDNERLNITIDGHDQGIASGQFAVFYEGERCIGSAIIS